MMHSLTHPAAATTEPPLILSDDQPQTELSAYLAMLIDQRWLIIGIALAIAALGTLYAFVAKPQYEANLLVHVEEKGQREPKNILGEAGSMIDYKTPAAAEIELLRSRLVVAQAIDKLRLYISAEPRRFPVLGKWVADSDLAQALPWLNGLGGYAWDKEKIDVTVFSVPDKLENRPFELTAQTGGGFVLREEESGILIRGQVGELVRRTSAYGPIELQIEQLQAQAGTRFLLTRSSRLAAIENVQLALNVAELGKQSGVLSATLKGENPLTVFQLMTEIGRVYMLQNGARRTEEADKSLAYLNQRLPELKQQLEQAEARYNQFRNTHGTVDLGEEAKINLQRSAAARTRRIELEQKRTELLSRFTANHPSVMTIDAQLRDVARETRDSASQIKTLPVLEQEMVRLARDVKVNSELYTALLASAQQLQLITVGKTGNVRLVDAPIKPERPVSPNRPRVIAVSVFAGLFLGMLVAFMRRSLRTALDDPEQVEKMFGLPVYASIPRSKMQQSLSEADKNSVRLPLLARIASVDVAVESLRTFRAALQFSMTHAHNNIVLISGPTAGVGKSFVSANLAALMAASGRKILLIDGDLRDGHLHRYFNTGRAGGLADLLAGTGEADGLIHKNVLENLDFIATGSLPPHPSELLLRPALASTLAQLAPRYDMVLIDGTPLLAVSDSLILGTQAAAIFLATRAGVTTPSDIAESLKRLARAGLAAKGLLFNDITTRPGRYGYAYQYGKYRQLSYAGGLQRSGAPADA
jgi:tyrosine-protein kinase Etk/Wzc